MAINIIKDKKREKGYDELFDEIKIMVKLIKKKELIEKILPKKEEKIKISI